eukprot:jgi/Bigna1/71917/fgenesh1_pg.17_\
MTGRLDRRVERRILATILMLSATRLIAFSTSATRPPAQRKPHLLLRSIDNNGGGNSISGTLHRRPTTSGKGRAIGLTSGPPKTLTQTTSAPKKSLIGRLRSRVMRLFSNEDNASAGQDQGGGALGNINKADDDDDGDNNDNNARNIADDGRATRRIRHRGNRNANSINTTPRKRQGRSHSRRGAAPGILNANSNTKANSHLRMQQVSRSVSGTSSSSISPKPKRRRSAAARGAATNDESLPSNDLRKPPFGGELQQDIIHRDQATEPLGVAAFGRGRGTSKRSNANNAPTTTTRKQKQRGKSASTSPWKQRGIQRSTVSVSTSVGSTGMRHHVAFGTQSGGESVEEYLYHFDSRYPPSQVEAQASGCIEVAGKIIRRR